ncbi:MAG TPA: tyrosine-type recombinase/integrase [Rhizomicrobium sp.]|jgi:integrase|nr:tyrosine-type recombinase/integrase [Rhizomicrobium sp.]
MKVRLLDGTGAREYAHIIEDEDRHGNVRVYLRKTKRTKKIRLRATPGTPEFDEEYRKALGMVTPAKSLLAPKDESLRWLISQYYASGEFKTLVASSQKSRRLVLDALCVEPTSDDDATPIGDLPYRMMTPPVVRKLRDRKLDTPAAANARVKYLRVVFGWAVENDKADMNPCRDVKKFKSDSDGWHTWTIEEVFQFLARHPLGSKARLALALLLFVGSRRVDVVTLGRQNERSKGTELHYTPIKTRRSNKKVKSITVPLLKVLRVVIDATPSGHLNYLVTEFGKPFTAAGFGNKFREWCDEAGLEHCSAHGLRKAGATIAAENGATPHQLMAIYGWSSLQEAETYTLKARQKLLAQQAMHLIDLKPESSTMLALIEGKKE